MIKPNTENSKLKVVGNSVDLNLLQGCSTGGTVIPVKDAATPLKLSFNTDNFPTN